MTQKRLLLTFGLAGTFVAHVLLGDGRDALRPSPPCAALPQGD